MKLRAERSKPAYRQLCEAEMDVPLFLQDWWLDATAGPDGWEVLVAQRGDEIAGALPYVPQKRYGFTILTQPALTQVLGPWLRPSQAKYAKALAYEKDVLGMLADALPTFSLYGQNWHHARSNWLPFYWRGFTQTTRYTYVLDGLSDEDRLWAGVQENIRGDIRKARNRFGIVVREVDSVDELLALNRMTFERQRKQLPYSDAFVRRLDATCAERKCRQILVAEDPEGRAHAAAFIVWDRNTAYYLIGGGDSELRNSGAGSLLLWEAIRVAARHVDRFDFEGSMLEPVERFFRGFGARQVPYFRVTKTSSRLLRFAQALRQLSRP